MLLRDAIIQWIGTMRGSFHRKKSQQQYKRIKEMYSSKDKDLIYEYLEVIAFCFLFRNDIILLSVLFINYVWIFSLLFRI